MPRLPVVSLVLLLASTSAGATPEIERRGGCDAFVDLREIRLRTPDATVTGRIVPGSVAEPQEPELPVGMQLIFGHADLAAEDGTKRRISYIYERSVDGCGGWTPGRGGRFTFELLDDHAADGAFRVMRYVPLR